MKLGAFSISLAVEDLQKSQQFYEKLGFEIFAGSHEMSYLIMRNGRSLIGLFQGMFPNNIITFNPGWDENGQVLDSYDDIREIQKSLKENEVELLTETDASGSGPANIMVMDPDGNQILIDQHI